VEKVVEYLSFKAQFQDPKPNEDIPDFLERIPPEIALELCVPLPTFPGRTYECRYRIFRLMAADYLDSELSTLPPVT
jgi:hypothetical protein